MPVRGVVILSHGYAEHAGRYTELARYLTNAGYALYAFDHRGHGLSEGEQANIGVFREYVHDLKRFIEWVREQNPHAPRFLLGHSMGGVIAAQLVIEHPHKVNGLILSAPFLRNASQVSPVLTRLANFISKYFPTVPVQALDATAISRDSNEVHKYQTDPLVYNGRVKARLGAELLNAGPYVLARAASITMPVLILHGTHDKLADISGSQDFYDDLSSADKTIKRYDGHYHELFNDNDRERVYSDVLEWLHQRSQPD